MHLRFVCVLLGVFTLFLMPFEAASAESLSENQSYPSAQIASSPLAAAFERKGLRLGSPVFLRVYKQTSEVELWVQKGSRYHLYKTFGICRWSGGLGPKFAEGDRQSPEGLYHITSADLIVNRRWHRAMKINYPNTFDLDNGRTGSSILIHGKCSSIGCFAIQDQNVEEVYGAVKAAIQNGQMRIPVLSLPFRFSMVESDPSELGEFWTDLRRADMLFERDRVPPSAWICDGRYYFADRRGDRHRHFVHLPGCKPLDRRLSTNEAEERSTAARPRLASLTLAERFVPPKDAAEKEARSCNPHNPHCRLLRVAIKSHVICPKKYARCRTAHAAYTKSADCPLKYPRCKRFVGRAPGRIRSASLSTRHHHHRR